MAPLPDCRRGGTLADGEETDWKEKYLSGSYLSSLENHSM